MSAKSTIKQSQTQLKPVVQSAVLSCFFLEGGKKKKKPYGFFTLLCGIQQGAITILNFFSRPPNSKLKLNVMRATWSSEYFKA